MQLKSAYLGEFEPEVDGVHNGQANEDQVVLPPNGGACSWSQLKPQYISEHQRGDRNSRALCAKMGREDFRGNCPTVDVDEAGIAGSMSALL